MTLERFMQRKSMDTPTIDGQSLEDFAQELWDAAFDAGREEGFNDGFKEGRSESEK